MRVGCARVSTDDQTLDLQRDALTRVKCRQIYEEHASGKSAARPQLEACLPTVETHLKGFWYSNFFWVLPDKHVYMALGRYGQVIMIFPDLDVVAVTTGHKGYPPSEFADAVSGSVNRIQQFQLTQRARSYSQTKYSTSQPTRPTRARAAASARKQPGRSCQSTPFVLGICQIAWKRRRQIIWKITLSFDFKISLLALTKS
jgi:hypothetical protein